MCIRNEDPRPYLKRDSELINLNGKWDFDFDDENLGHKEKWFLDHSYSKSIEVPFPFQSKLSGINDPKFHDYMWYHRSFDVTFDANKKYIITFNGVDYESEIYINGFLVSKHIGGASINKVDISDFVVEGKNELTVFCYDDSRSQDFPRGKQYWKEKSESIFYTRTSGIYKNVYLEILNNNYIDEYYISSDIDRGEVKVETLTLKPAFKIEYVISLKGIELARNVVYTKGKDRVISKIKVWNNQDIMETFFHNGELCWSPDNPVLYDINIKVYQDEETVIDNVSTYFAMRKIAVENGAFSLNNRVFYQKLVLIQGYFKDGLLAYPSIDDLINDIKLAKEMGFNGGRIHQKIEDPYFYYLCDKLGFICWLECPSAQVFNNGLIELQSKEWSEIVKQYFNFPSIFTLVPLNESWGVPELNSDPKQVHFQNALYHLTKSLDATRLVVGNDGWEMASTDICSIHNYRHGNKDDLIQHEKFEKSLADKDVMMHSCPGNRVIFLEGYENKKVPFMLTEFGGISFLTHMKEGWGYTNVNSEKDFLAEYKRIIEAIAKSDGLCGFCYTQLYDVEQEINGLLTYTRKPKTDPENIKKINDIVNKDIIFIK